MKIKELYSNSSKWTKGAFARDAFGDIQRAQSDNACCWCLAGAIIRCYSREQGLKIEKLIEEKVNTGLVQWNDDPNRTFKEIKNLVEDLDI